MLLKESLTLTKITTQFFILTVTYQDKVSSNRFRTSSYFLHQEITMTIKRIYLFTKLICPIVVQMEGTLNYSKRLFTTEYFQVHQSTHHAI